MAQVVTDLNYEYKRSDRFQDPYRLHDHARNPEVQAPNKKKMSDKAPSQRNVPLSQRYATIRVE